MVLYNDNDHTDDPSKWISIEDIPKLFPGVPSIVYTSRDHMKQKGDRSPRPRFHVVFLVGSITNPKIYTELMHRIQAAYPFLMTTLWMPVDSSSETQILRCTFSRQYHD